MNGALLMNCSCPKATVQSGHAIVYDPIAEHWTLIVWPVQEGPITVYGVAPVSGCPVCLKPVSKEAAYLSDDIPGECLDHLMHLHAGDALAQAEPTTPFELAELPQPMEV